MSATTFPLSYPSAKRPRSWRRSGFAAFLAILALCFAAAGQPARAQQTGTLDSGFDAGSIIGGSPIRGVAVQPDGKVLVAGSFSAVAGISRSTVARLNGDGSVDTGFEAPVIESYDTRSDSQKGIDPNFQALMETVLLQPDGKIVLGGNFYFVNGKPGFGGLVRLNADGSVDGSFDAPRFNGTVYSVIRASGDGSYYVAGDFTAVDKMTDRNALVRLDAKGKLDTKFKPGKFAGTVLGNTGLDAQVLVNVRALALQSDGKLLAGGTFSTIDGQSIRGLARLNADDGSVDGSFSVDADFNPAFNGLADTSVSEIRAIVLQPDGKILVGGSFFDPQLDPQTNSAAPRNGLRRLTADGGADGSFNAGGVGVLGSVNALLLEDGGGIVFAGSFNSYNGARRQFLARTDTAGALDLNFNSTGGPNFDVLSLASADNGQAVAGGFFILWSEAPRQFVARFNTGASAPPGVVVNVRTTAGRAREDGRKEGRFRFSRAGGNLLAPVTVQFTLVGTATPKTDYRLRGPGLTPRLRQAAGAVIIPAGSASVEIFVAPVEDQEIEGKEKVILTLTDSAAYETGLPGSAQVTILDND